MTSLAGVLLLLKECFGNIQLAVQYLYLSASVSMSLTLTHLHNPLFSDYSFTTASKA